MESGPEHIAAMRRGHDLVIRRIRPLMIVMGTIVACFIGAAFLIDEGEIVTLVSLDSSGMEHETQLWFVRIEDVQYLRASSAKVEWLERVKVNSLITVERREVRAVFEATPSEDPRLRSEVNLAMAKKYGLADRVWGLISDRRGSVPIRLDPGPPDAEPLWHHSRHRAEKAP